MGGLRWPWFVGRRRRLGRGPVRLEAQDSALSRHQQGFESPTGRQYSPIYDCVTYLLCETGPTDPAIGPTFCLTPPDRGSRRGMAAATATSEGGWADARYIHRPRHRFKATCCSAVDRNLAKVVVQGPKSVARSNIHSGIKKCGLTGVELSSPRGFLETMVEQCGSKSDHLMIRFAIYGLTAPNRALTLTCNEAPALSRVFTPLTWPEWLRIIESVNTKPTPFACGARFPGTENAPATPYKQIAERRSWARVHRRLALTHL